MVVIIILFLSLLVGLIFAFFYNVRDREWCVPVVCALIASLMVTILIHNHDTSSGYYAYYVNGVRVSSLPSFSWQLYDIVAIAKNKEWKSL